MMSTPTLIDVELMQEWSREAGRIALSQLADLEIQIKSDRTLVTEIDRRIEAFLVERISHRYPGHGILAEEGSSRTGNDFTWIVDPIDGTRAFASGLPVWGISLGVLHAGTPYAGVFYMPATGEMIWGTETEAFYNNRRLLPPPRVDLDSPVAFISVPSNAHRDYDISFPRLRSLGSTTAHLAYVAHGSAVGALTRRIQLWDIAAVLPVLKITETALVYLDGEILNPADLLNGELSRQPLVAAHTSIINEVRAFIQRKPNDVPRSAG